MRQNVLRISFFILLLLGTLYSTFLVAKPFITALFLAIIAAVIFYPLYERMVAWMRGRVSLAAATSVILASLIIAIPLLFFASLILNQAYSVYSNVSNGVDSFEKIDKLIVGAEAFVNRFVPGQDISFSGYANVREIALRFLSTIVTNANGIASGIFKGVLNLFIFILAFFYLLRDGKKLFSTLMSLSPLNDTHDRQIGVTASKAVNSVIKGYLVVALVQGVLSGVGYMFFGLPAPAMWGFAAGLSALIPSVGTSLIHIPAIIYLMTTGHVVAGVALIVWAVIVVGLVDNLLAPILINRGMSVHPFLILLSLLGGVSVFGPIGFVAGPVILSLLFALLHMYPIIMVRSEDRTPVMREENHV